MATSHVVTAHPETMKVQLEADGIGFGLSLMGGATERGVLPLLISAIEEGGPAARLGQLQVKCNVFVRVTCSVCFDATVATESNGHCPCTRLRLTYLSLS